MPDLAAIVDRLPDTRINLSLSAIAQWAAIALGGLLAAWLVFGGGRPPAREADEAPPWAPANHQAAAAAPQAANAPNSGVAGSQAPAWQQPAPPVSTPGNPPGLPASDGPTPAAPDWNDPDWHNSATTAPPAANPHAQPVRTARRVEVNQPPAAGQGGNAQPLDITVPVPQ